MQNENIGVSIIIPSKTEKFLNHTIIDVLKNATGNVEVLPVLDGYELPEEELIHDPRVRYVKLESSKSNQKRHGINKAAGVAKYDYLMALDAHCSVSVGFDEVLIESHQSNWVQVPQRRRLDPENWCEQDQRGRPPISYEYIMWNSLLNDHQIHGYKWDQRTIERKDILIDDTAEFQGSCWFMTRDWFNYCGFMQIEGYSGWGSEAEEIALKTRQMGGFVKTNKKCHYCHTHKGRKYGRQYHLNRKETKQSRDYAYDYWVIKNKDFFIEYINSFPLMPKWPSNWVDLIYNKK